MLLGAFIAAVAAVVAAALLVALAPLADAARRSTPKFKPFRLDGQPVRAITLTDMRQFAALSIPDMPRLKADGFNMVTIYAYRFMDSGTANEQKTGVLTEPDASLGAAIDAAHAAGLAVQLIPTIWVGTGLNAFYWRGAIHPTDENAWFDSYREMIAHYGDLATQHKVEIYGIGSEMISLENEVSQWRHTITEARSHFALWAMLDAPLMIGADLRKIPPSLMDIFGNAHIIALDQDPAGNQATLTYDSSDVHILVKTLASGDKAVAIFNRGSGAYDVDLHAFHLKFADNAPIELTDLWSKRETNFIDHVRLHVRPRETLLFRAHGTRAMKGGYYLSEIPGRVNPAVDGVTYPTPDPTIFRTAAGWAGTNGAGDRPTYAGWGGARADSTPYGQVLQISGKPFRAGIGILANSRMEVRNDGARQFKADVGVDDSATDKSHSVVFSIYGDGKLIGRSRPLKQGMPAEALAAPIDGVRLIELVARSTGAQNERLPVTWGDAALLDQ